VAHVGNSRAYLLRDGELQRLTEDHTIAELRQRRGRSARDNASDGEVLYQCLGGSFEVEVDLAEVRVMGQDVLLLCTDGLIRVLEEKSILDMMDPNDLKESVRKLLRAAVQLGAIDDVSVVLVGLDDENQPSNTLETVTQTLKDIFLFKDMTEQELLVIAPYLEEEVFDKGDVIVTEGQPGDCFYIIISGHVRVSRNNLHLVDIAGGGHFGEISLARPVKRSATVKALTPVRMFSFSQEQFHRVIRNKPDLGAKMALHLLDAVGDRVRDLTNRLDTVQKLMNRQKD
jgi:CRP-like cAMP-binding protein